MHYQIAPHGGELVNRVLRGSEREFWIEKGRTLPAVTLEARGLSDVELIANGAMSPLEGFMCRDEYTHVIDHMRLTTGLPWTLPVVLGVNRDQADEFDVDAPIALKDRQGTVIAILHLEEKYIVNKEKEVAKLYKTGSAAHPGVAYVLKQRGDVLLGGDIDVVNMPVHEEFGKYRLSPSETRHAFEKLGWSRVVAFQTNRPIHRAHEYIVKCALEFCDGLLIHPLVSAVDTEGIPPAVRMHCYEELIEKYFPEERIMMSVFPAYVRHAGPREVIYHALLRKNYGCTHCIIRHNQAGMEQYYAANESREIFKEFGQGELEITPVFFEEAVYCKVCHGMVTAKTCPHDAGAHVFASGDELQKMLEHGTRPPEEIMRPEIAQVLIGAAKKSAR